MVEKMTKKEIRESRAQLTKRDKEITAELKAVRRYFKLKYDLYSISYEEHLNYLLAGLLYVKLRCAIDFDDIIKDADDIEAVLKTSKLHKDDNTLACINKVLSNKKFGIGFSVLPRKGSKLSLGRFIVHEELYELYSSVYRREYIFYMESAHKGKARYEITATSVNELYENAVRKIAPNVTISYDLDVMNARLLAAKGPSRIFFYKLEILLQASNSISELSASNRNKLSKAIFNMNYDFDSMLTYEDLSSMLITIKESSIHTLNYTIALLINYMMAKQAQQTIKEMNNVKILSSGNVDIVHRSLEKYKKKYRKVYAYCPNKLIAIVLATK